MKGKMPHETSPLLTYFFSLFGLSTVSDYSVQYC